MHELPTAIPAASLAALAELSERQLRTLAQAGVVQRTTPGFYRTEPSIRGLFGYYRKGKADATDGDLDPAQERARLDVTRRLKLEDEIRLRRRELVESMEVEELFTGLVRMVTTNLDRLPDLLERDHGMTGPQAQQVRDSIDTMRDAMAVQCKEFAAKNASPPATEDSTA